MKIKIALVLAILLCLAQIPAHRNRGAAFEDIALGKVVQPPSIQMPGSIVLVRRNSDGQEFRTVLIAAPQDPPVNRGDVVTLERLVYYERPGESGRTIIARPVVCNLRFPAISQ